MKKIDQTLPVSTGKVVQAASLADILGFRAPKAKVPTEWKGYHAKLLALRRELSESLEGRSRSYREGIENTGGGDEVDQATNEQIGVTATTGLRYVQTQIRDIDVALEKINKGTYGVCEYTGKPISKTRLDALPYTRYSQEGEKLYRQDRKTRELLEKARDEEGTPALDDASTDVLDDEDKDKDKDKKDPDLDADDVPAVKKEKDEDDDLDQDEPGIHVVNEDELDGDKEDPAHPRKKAAGKQDEPGEDDDLGM